MSVAPASPAPPLPAGWRLRPTPRLRTFAEGTVLVGGAPLRVLRLSSAGARVVAGWWAGAPVGEGLAERRLARRLLDAALAHPDPPSGAAPEMLSVVIPTRDRPEELRRCLAALDPRCRVMVVDDGSADAATIAAVAGRADAEYVRLEPSHGPSAARNAGLREIRTPFVAFVDSDCVVAPGFPGRLLDHLGDPAVAVVAPRIVGLAPGGGGLLARHEAHHSSLDMGPREGLVQAATPIPYAPGAALVARVAALGDGFDETLRLGEDVDLIWRLGDAGWRVRYDPAVAVAHEHRVSARAWFLRRVAYDAASAPLARRHPGRAPALEISRSGALFWAALACGVPVAAATVSAMSVATLTRRLRRHVPAAAPLAARLVVGSHLHEGRHLARTLTGPWLPFLIAATAVRPRAGRRLWLGATAGLVADWAQERHEPTPLGYAVPRLAGDLARGAGAWRGCLRERSVATLLPRLR